MNWLRKLFAPKPIEKPNRTSELDLKYQATAPYRFVDRHTNDSEADPDIYNIMEP